METVFEDNWRRVIQGNEKISFSVRDGGLYVIAVSARCKGEKQLHGTDDEDFRIEIDGVKFPKLTNSREYSAAPAAFSGGQLHNLKKTVYVILELDTGQHSISLIADSSTSAQFESLSVFKTNTTKRNASLQLSPQTRAEDGDRYPWITFVFVDLAISSIHFTLTLKKRFIDSDDVKVIIDGKTQQNFLSVLHKFWYFIANKHSSTIQSTAFTPHLVVGRHYVELWADRMPVLNTVNMVLGTSTPNKIQRYKPSKLNYDYNKLDEYIINATDFWNSFFVQESDPPPILLNPNLVKAILYRESRLGYYPDNKIIDVMQVWDPQNPSRDAILSKTSANEFINPKEIGHMKYSYPKNKIPPTVTTRENSIFWGIRWLYYKAQYLQEDTKGNLKIPYVRDWFTWRKAVEYYNGNPKLVEDYVKEVFSVYKEGVDLEGNVLWEKS